MADVRQAALRMLQGDGVGIYIDRDGRVRTSEGFFKAIGKMIKALAQLPKLLVMLISQAVPMAISLMGDIMKILPLAIKAFFISFKYIASDPLRFLLKVFQVILGSFVLFVLVVSKHLLAYVAVLLVALIAVLPEWCLWNFVTLLFMTWSIMLAMIDQLSGGVVRFIARSEDHPEAWWRLDGFEDGNGNTRIIGTLKPCASGYAPSALGMTCKKLDRSCVAAACPLATLMRSAQSGSFRSLTAVATGQRILPSESSKCRKKIRIQAAKCTAALLSGRRKVNGQSLDPQTMKGLAQCLSLCRLHTPSGDTVTKRRLAELAMSGDPLTPLIIGPLTSLYSVSEVSGQHKLTVAASIVLMAWTAVKVAEVLQTQ